MRRSDSATALVIGAFYNLGSDYYAGTLDELAIYNYVLTLAKVQAHRNAALWPPAATPPPPGPIPGTIIWGNF
jgi:hypothetical protein